MIGVMRYHVIFGHPVETSYSASVFKTACRALADAGHDVDPADLYAEGFEPCLSRQERQCYHDTEINTQGVESYVDRLRAADGVVMVFPVWNFGPPAIVKGWLDRVWLPGVAFRLDSGSIRPALDNIRRFAVVVSYGQREWIVRWVIGDPLRKQLMRSSRRCLNRQARTLWMPLYDMNRNDDDVCRRHLDRVAAGMTRLCAP